MERWEELSLVLGFLSLVGWNASALERAAYWQNDADGRWTDAFRWSTPNFPNNNGSDLYSATIDSPSRTITLDRNITLESFNLSRGALEGTNAPVLWLNQQFHWSGTKLAGGGLFSANGMTMSGGTKTVRGWLMENRGVANWLGGDLHLGDGTRFYNNSGAGFNAGFDGTIINDQGGSALFENAGTFRKSAGTNQTKIYIPFLNMGAIEVDQGELAFFGSSTNLGGTIEVLEGASIQFTGLNHFMDSASTLRGGGTFEFDNGTVEFNGSAEIDGEVVIGNGTLNLAEASTIAQLGASFSIARSGTLNANSGQPIFWNSLTVSNGTLNGSDELHSGSGGFFWSGGTIKGTGRILFDGPSIFAGGPKTLRGRLAENFGAIQWDRGDLYTGDGSRFVNRPAGSMQMSFDGGWFSSSGGPVLFENLGTFVKMGGTNSSTFALPVSNEGIMLASAGSIRFGNSLTNRGALSMGPGGSFTFAAANIQLTALGSLDGEGEVILNSGTVVNSGSFRAGSGVTLKAGVLRFTNTTSRPNFGSQVAFHNFATLDLGSGHATSVPRLFQTNGLVTGRDDLVISNEWICVNGDIDGSGRLELRGISNVKGNARWSGRRVVNQGELSWTGGDLDSGPGLFLHNTAAGTFWLTCDRSFNGSTSGTTTFLNDGSLRKDSGAGTNGTGTSTLGMPFINNGSVTVNSGRIQFNGGFTQTNGLLALNGTAVGSSKPFLLHGGGLAGSGTLFGSVSNAGTIYPGWGNGIGRLEISGNYTQSVTAALKVELASTHAHDVLAITGQANLDGRLEISLLPGYTPAEGDTFPILTCGARVGQFTQIAGLGLSEDLKLVPVYQANGVTLTVARANLPPPLLTIQPVAGGSVKVSWPDGLTGWALMGATNLLATNWIDLPSAGTNFVVLPAGQTNQFFRLVGPSNEP